MLYRCGPDFGIVRNNNEIRFTNLHLKGSIKRKKDAIFGRVGNGLHAQMW